MHSGGTLPRPSARVVARRPPPTVPCRGCTPTRPGVCGCPQLPSVTPAARASLSPLRLPHRPGRWSCVEVEAGAERRPVSVGLQSGSCDKNWPSDEGRQVHTVKRWYWLSLSLPNTQTQSSGLLSPSCPRLLSAPRGSLVRVPGRSPWPPVVPRLPPSNHKVARALPCGCAGSEGQISLDVHPWDVRSF